MPENRERIQPQPLDPERQAFADAIQGATFELLGMHEAESHGGEPCGHQRVSHVAWIAHSLGIGTAHLQKLMAAIAMYESDCPCGVPTLLPRHFADHIAAQHAEQEDFKFDDMLDPSRWTETASINFLCDDCRASGSLHSLTTGLANQEAAEGFARERGWRLEDGRWRCPAHAKGIRICHWPACRLTTEHGHCHECGSTEHGPAFCDRSGRASGPTRCSGRRF